MSTRAISKAEKAAKAAQARARRIADAAAEQSDKITGLGVSVLAAGGMGYWMAKSSDTDGQWFGVDKELIIGGLLALIAFGLGARRDRSSQMTSGLALSAATGILSAYTYGMAFSKGQEG